MEALRVSTAPLRLADAGQPAPRRAATGALGEAEEATLVLVRGAVATTPRRSSAQNVYFDLDDGSGPMRVYLSPRAGVQPAEPVAGTWLEVIGVLAQETTGRQPERGYRIWPRQAADVSVIPVGASVAGGPTGAASRSGTSGAGGSAAGAGAAVAAGARTVADGLVPPRLARAIATASPAPVVTGATEPAPVDADGGLLVLAVAGAGAVVLLGASWLLAGPSLLERLGRLRTARQEAPGGPDGTDPIPVAGDAFSPGTLVALEVLDGGSRPASGSRGRDRP
jgi:hypothetical protein